MTNDSDTTIPLMRPSLPTLEEICEVFRESYESGIVTNGRVVAELEDAAALFTSTKQAVAVSSCTSGLILAFACGKFPEGAEVVVPSFTFAATVGAVTWNGLTPVYVDCRPETLTMDPEEVRKAIGPATAAICPVNIFGLPPDMDRLTEISVEYRVPLIFDSAQGLGSTYKGKPTGGFGLCEVFSLSPSKVVTALEGGLVTTNDEDTAEAIRSMRDYGKGPGGEEMASNGLSARMSELHASVGLLGLRNVDNLIDSRLRLIRRYTRRIGRFPGCRVQEVPDDRTSSGNYFTIRIGEDAALDRDRVMEVLQKNHVECKRYFGKPVHDQGAFRSRPHRLVGDLKNTWTATRECVALPLYAHMTDQEQDRVCEILEYVLGEAESPCRS
ncbi:MAG: DegT/DnrJ/EryC1/StrS family aminotransferase [Desulfomonilaceae bacterium]|nr:DegT/DnrJ/EryC1/StrS family aminotransferase [Desulfomonilaceae bacterium]